MNRPIKIVLLPFSALLAGTLGYQLIEGWSFFDALYMSVITLATVGYGEVHPLSYGGRVFTVALVLGGMGILLYSVTELTSFVVEGRINGLLRKRRMNKLISSLVNHYIVCGYGRGGSYVTEELVRTKRKVVVIENNIDRVAVLERHSLPFIEGDATDDSVLQAAGIGRAAGIVCALPSDKDNLFAVITARGLNPSIRIIAEVDEITSREKFLRSGANSAVSPNYMGGLRMASELVRPETVSFLDTMLRDSSHLRVEDIKLSNRSTNRQTIQECRALIDSSLLVLAIRSGSNQRFNPPPDTTISVGDVLIVMGTPDQLDCARSVL